MALRPVNKDFNDFFLEVAKGDVLNHTAIHKFGANPSITSSSTEDITFSGIINWITSATTMRVKSGGNAADTSAGSGARTITIVGLDENWDDVEEDIILAGASASAVTTTTFCRVFRIFVLTTGTYTGVNTGDITLENGTGGTDYITIGAGEGQTETSEYTVPAGKTAYLTRLSAEVDAGKAVDVKMWQRQNADAFTAPFSSKRVVTEYEQLIGQASESLNSYIVFPEKTDLWWTGATGSGANAAVEVDYDLFLVSNQ